MNTVVPKDLGEAHRALGAKGLLDTIHHHQRPFTPGRQPPQTLGELPPIIDVMDFLGKPLTKPPELIKGILHKGSKLILSGASKSRKTWALTHLAICVAAGLPWWGFETTPGRVLYANFELAPEFFQERVVAIKDHLVLEGSKLKGKLDLWNLRGHATDIENLADQIIERTKDRYDLIILDPIYKILGDRDENSNSEVALMMIVFDRIIKDSGAAIAFAHHFSKGNQSKKNAMDRMSGAGAFARDADALLVMTEHDQPDTYAIQPILRYHKLVAPFCVTLNHPIMERWDGADPAKLKNANVPQKKHFVADLVDLFKGEELRRVELQQRYTDAKLGSSGTFNNLFREARDNDHIEECDNGKKWRPMQTKVEADEYQSKMDV